MSDATGVDRTPASNLAVASWVLYDFANSAFPTLVVTFVFATWFISEGGVVGDPELGTTIWGNLTAASGLLVALLSPILGAIADRGGYKREFLVATVVICVIATAGLYWAGLPGQIWIAGATFLVANVFFEMGLVFYNAFLPDLNRPAGGFGPLRRLGAVHDAFRALLERFVARVYQPWIRLSLRWRYAVAAFGLMVLFVTAGVVRGQVVKFVIFPQIDSDFLTAHVDFPDGTPTSVMSGAQVGSLLSASQSQSSSRPLSQISASGWQTSPPLAICTARRALTRP